LNEANIKKRFYKPMQSGLCWKSLISIDFVVLE
jgi:hypothetical protein